MEKVNVTFKKEGREISIDFELNDDTGNLDYQVQVTPPFESESDVNNGGLDVYLANTLLGSLQVESEFINNSEEVIEK